MPEKPVHIAQISDLHIKPPGSLAYGRVDTAAALERCVAALNAFRPRPDFVVISGDLADTPTAEEYQYLKRLLAPLELPFAGIPGNHDSRELMRAAFPSAAYAFPSGPLNQRVEIAGLDLLLLDSSVPGKPHGELDAPTLQWLEAMLASSPDRPALLFLHHPPFKTGIWHMDRQNLLNAAELAAVVSRHPRVQRIATGHVHRATLTMFAGVADHDLPGAQSRRRSRSGRTARALLQGRAAGFSSPQLVSRRGFWQRRHPPGPDRPFRRPASVFRAGREVALRGWIS